MSGSGGIPEIMIHHQAVVDRFRLAETEAKGEEHFQQHGRNAITSVKNRPHPKRGSRANRSRQLPRHGLCRRGSYIWPLLQASSLCCLERSDEMIASSSLSMSRQATASPAFTEPHDVKRIDKGNSPGQREYDEERTYLVIA